MEVTVTLSDACGYEYTDVATYEVGLTGLRSTAILISMDEPTEEKTKSFLDRFKKK